MKQLLIIFLLMSSVTSAVDFNVTWTPIKEDIVNKEYLITVQNLKDEMWTVDVKSFFEDTNFDTSQVHDVQLIDCESNKFESKVLKKNKLEKEVSHGKITFPSVKTLGKKNNKGTKTFILKFKTPPNGSHGKVGLKINGKEYHPYWNSTWSNRKKITLTGNTSGSQTDYQILLNVTYEPEMNLDFSDVRFCNDTDQLSTWLESKVNESYALIWVKFPHTPADGETEDYWMYYGNSEASACWNGNATFEFFDDFEDGNISDWDAGDTLGKDHDTMPVCENGYIKSLNDKSGMHKSISLLLNTYIIKYRIFFDGDQSYNYFWSALIHTSGSSGQYYTHFCTQSAPDHEGMKVMKDDMWNGEIALDDDEVFTGNEWHDVEFMHINDGTWQGTHNDNNVDFNDLNNADTSYNNFSSINLCFRLANQRCDMILIHKYIANPPTYVFGDTGYYVDSIYFNSSNSYYNLIDYKGDIALNHTYSPSDNQEWTAQAVDDDVGFVITSMGSSEIGFSIYESVLDWLQLVNLDDSKIYTLQNGSGNLEEHQASGNAVNFTTDLSPDDYEIEITAVPTASPTATPTGVQPANYSGTKLSDTDIKSFYYPFMYILFIVIIIGGFMHVFGN